MMNQRVYKKNGSVVTRKIAGEVILVPVSGKLADMQKIFSLDEVAEFIWEHIDGVRSIGDLTDCVLEAFDAEADQAGRDVKEFVESLKAAGLVSELG